MAKMKILPLLASVLLAAVLTGCGQEVPEETLPTETVPAATVPADGNPNDVTCKGTYTGTGSNTAVAAKCGELELSNEVLRAYYWAEVASYRASGETPAPDFSQSLDTQPCEVDSGLGSWQQYFLRRALNTWHSAAALRQQGQAEGLPIEEAYNPYPQNHGIYMTDIPATKFLYRYEKSYQPNTMHQAYLDSISETLEELAETEGYASAAEMAQKAFGTSLKAMEAFATDYNYGYMYYTDLAYYIEPTEEDIENYFTENEQAYEEAGMTRDSDSFVDFRHILLLPEEDTEEGWENCEAEAESLLDQWLRKAPVNEGSFAAMAFRESQDEGSALNGGAYRQVAQSQLQEELADWCFSEEREPGDTTILRTESGIHILYFARKLGQWYIEAEKDYRTEQQADNLTVARTQYPLEVSYSKIVLTEGEGTVAYSDVLYPDVAHERFPEVPLYLQQEYPGTMYGGHELKSNGCGITTLAMLASYMADDELTPPEMCALYGRYSFNTGTDGMIFINEPPVLGFYFREKTYEPKVAYAALEEGQLVVSVQHPGYWTRAGHYLVLEKLTEDGKVQVRDSNLYNYGRIQAHKEDKHTWNSIIANGSGFWIFEDKVTTIPACSRCGSPEGEGILTEEYLCEKCRPAMLRRGNFLELA